MNWRIAVLLSFALAAGAWAASSPNEECLSCHDEQGAKFKASVHGSSGLGCRDCHTSISKYPHPEKQAPVNCAGCHADNVKNLAQSVHAGASAQTCKNCHGDFHEILAKTDLKSTVYPTNLPRTCGACHGSKEMAKQHGITEVYSQYVDSIHGFALTKDGLLVAASCSSCHGSHQILSSKNPKSRTFRANVPETCGACHGGPKEAYLTSVHGQALEAGSQAAPVCTDCHTSHQIARVETAAWQIKTTATCGGCHQKQLSTYRDTFHAQVSATGYIETARCWDCHGFHDILPASNPKSSIAKANLPATCGKCHEGANQNLIRYQPHADKDNVAAYPMLHYSAVFMNLLLSGVLGFFALHAILWLIRSLAERRAARLAGER